MIKILLFSILCGCTDAFVRLQRHTTATHIKTTLSSFNFNINNQKHLNDINKNHYITSTTSSSSISSSSTTKLNMAIAERSYVLDNESDFAMDDFEQILESVYIFEQIHGDLDIELKFEVPAKSPWPTELHGLRLGKRLERLLSSQEFYQDYPNQVEALKKLNFNPNPKSLLDDWSIILKAIKHYKEVHGDVRIPSKFIVPDDDSWPRVTRKLKLGVRVAAMRSAGRYVKDHPSRKEDLDELGFEWRLRDRKSGEDFENFYITLVKYKELFGDLDVPKDFIVPSKKPWNEISWNINLGNLVQAARDKDGMVLGYDEREQKLAELGFTWEESGRALYSRKRFELIYETLKVYKDLNGDLLVPQAFVVPNIEPWPEVSWGLKLGARVNAMRSQGTLVANFPERRQRLNELGFTWELVGRSRERKEVRITKKEAEEKMLEDESDEGEISMNLDDHEKRIKSLGLPTTRGGSSMFGKSALNYDPTRMFEPVAYREIASEAMRDYIQAREFSDDPDIRNVAHFENNLSPESYHKVITRAIPSEDVKKMKKLGHRILDFGSFYWDDVIEALKVYHTVHGNVNVPEDFVIDELILADETYEFDERLEDLKLGQAVLSIRIGDVDGLEDISRKKQLEKLGFDWGDKSLYQRYRFLPMVLGLKVYRHLYGFPLPQSDFIVPDEPQWPIWMVGMPLGEWTAVARVQQQMLFKAYPERIDMLNAMEFLWWIPPGKIPTKYYRNLK